MESLLKKDDRNPSENFEIEIFAKIDRILVWVRLFWMNRD